MIDLFLDGKQIATVSDSEMDTMLDFLVSHDFFTMEDIKAAHQIMREDASMEMTEGAKSVLEVVINFLRVTWG